MNMFGDIAPPSVKFVSPTPGSVVQSPLEKLTISIDFVDPKFTYLLTIRAVRGGNVIVDAQPITFDETTLLYVDTNSYKLGSGELYMVELTICMVPNDPASTISFSMFIKAQ